MNIEPCVRLGIRISPKIRENPADSRNKRPPNVTLLTVSSSQNVITAAPLALGYFLCPVLLSFLLRGECRSPVCYHFAAQSGQASAVPNAASIAAAASS